MPSRLPSLVPVLAVLALLAAGCTPDAPTAPECLDLSRVPPGSPITELPVHFVTGANHLVLGNASKFDSGVEVKPSKARLFLSQLELVNEAGEPVAAEWVDASGERLEYGLTFVDLERPESLALRLRAPAGHYRAMRVSIGVPTTCESGLLLNHADASTLHPPLDVDSDMYWGWNPGFVFVKFEGEVASGAEWQPFFFHVGGDERFERLTLEGPFELGHDAEGPELIVDFERLLTTAAGTASPDIMTPEQRRVHGGEWADVMAANIAQGGFLRLAPGHH